MLIAFIVSGVALFVSRAGMVFSLNRPEPSHRLALLRRSYDGPDRENVTGTEEVAGELAERFEENRPRLRAVAYRMLGSQAEADDAVQEAWLRLSRAGGDVDNLAAWLTTVVGRVCLDMLRQRTARREEGPYVSEPPAGDPD